MASRGAVRGGKYEESTAEMSDRRCKCGGGSHARRAAITVRHGSALAHVPTVEAAAFLMQRFAAARPEERLSALGIEAQHVLLSAVEAVQLLGGATLAQGWQRWRGRGSPPHLVRDVRQLDAAAALLRHPGAADAVRRRLAAWL